MIKVEYDRDDFVDRTMEEHDVHFVTGGYSIGVSSSITHELTYVTDTALGLPFESADYPQFPKAKDTSVYSLFDVVKVTVLETTGAFLG